MKITSGHAPHGPDEVMVDEDTADKHHLGIGDEIGVISRRRHAHREDLRHRRPSRSPTPVPRSSTWTPPTAQQTLVGRDRRLHQRQRHRRGRRRRRAAQARTWPPPSAATTRCRRPQETADANQKDVERLPRRHASTPCSASPAIAFLVGIFLIFNTFSMLVAQRTREIGLLRALGSAGKQVNRSVLTEALLLGVVGSVLGVGAGVGIAVGLMKLMGQLGMHLSTDDLTVVWTTPVAGLRRRRPRHRRSPPSSRPGAPPGSPRWPRCATRGTPRPTPERAAVRALVGMLITAAGAAGLVRGGGRRPGDDRLAVAGPRRGPHPGRRSWSSARCSRAASCASSEPSCRARSDRSAGWPSATPCATRAAPAPPAPP